MGARRRLPEHRVLRAAAARGFRRVGGRPGRLAWQAHGVMTIVDATQALGWMPMDASRFDVVACAAYKWLMAPRGVAFMSVRRERLGALQPVLAGWFAAEDVHASYYGT